MNEFSNLSDKERQILENALTYYEEVVSLAVEHKIVGTEDWDKDFLDSVRQLRAELTLLYG